MTIYNKVIALTAAIALFAACDKDVIDINSDPFKDQTYTNTLSSPISTFLTEQGGYEQYVNALHYSGMFDALNQSSSGVSFTAFVPNNEAMLAFYKSRGVDSLKQLTADYMRQFILYHTVKDSILPDAFVLKKSVQNLNNDEIKIEIDSVHAGQALLNGEGRIIEMGLSAFNGKVYVLSSAMTPLVETIYDRVINAGTSNIMAEALRATGWDKKLSNKPRPSACHYPLLLHPAECFRRYICQSRYQLFRPAEVKTEERRPAGTE